MKKFMKKLAKKSEGFTLVELIVVIAILGILAGIAVPAYSGYLKKANEAADIVALDSIKTAAQAYKAQTDAVSNIEVIASSGSVTSIEVDDVVVFGTTKNAEFMLYLTGDGSSDTLPSAVATLSSDKFENGATWNATADSNGNHWVAATTAD